MKTHQLTYRSAHAFVKHTPSARWDGWDIVTFSPDNRAFYSTAGRFYNGQWGFEHRFKPTSKGTWFVNVAG